MNMHTKKHIKGTDLYKGMRAQQAEEERKRADLDAAERAKKMFAGKKMRVDPKIAKQVSKSRRKGE